MNQFKESVEGLVAEIPVGKVMYYSQIAALCGKPRAARQVGQIAHFGSTDLPWHRVVMKNGALANGYVPGGPSGQRRYLEEEGVNFDAEGKVVMERYLWQLH